MRRVMRVICPYTRLHPVVRAVLESYDVGAEFRHVPNPDSYWRLLSRLWEDGRDIVIVEHDCLPWPGALEELHGCPAMWCSCSYKMGLSSGRVGIGITHAFGVTKISGELMRLLPDVWKHAQREWWTLDSQLCAAALAIGQEPHTHRPPAIHLKGLAA